MKSQSSRFETTTGVTSHMVQSYPVKRVKRQGFTNHQTNPRVKDLLMVLNTKMLSDWENPLVAEPGHMQERLLMIPVFLHSS